MSTGAFSLRDTEGLSLPLIRNVSPRCAPSAAGTAWGGPHMDCGATSPDMLQSNVSTASLYGVPTPLDTAASLYSNDPKVSLWDLRSELKSALAGTDADSGSVVLPSESVHRMLAVMREHVQHNRVQRALRKELQNGHMKAEGLAKDVQRLTGQLTMLQTQPTVSPATSAGECGPPEATTTGCGLHSGGPKTPPPYWPASGVLPFAAASSAAAEASSAALLSGGAVSSMGGPSLKSDGLFGDEAEALQGKKDERKTGDGMRQCAALSHSLHLSESALPAVLPACTPQPGRSTLFNSHAAGHCTRSPTSAKRHKSWKRASSSCKRRPLPRPSRRARAMVRRSALTRTPRTPPHPLPPPQHGASSQG